MLGRNIIYSVCKSRNSSLFKVGRKSFDILPRNVLISFPSVCNARFKVTFKPISQREGPQPSRYHPGTAIDTTEEDIESILSEKTSMNNEDWENFKKDLMLDVNIINDENFCTVVMGCLLTMDNLDLAHSFIKYLEDGFLKPSFLTYFKYISLCSRHHRLVGPEHILNVLNKVKHIVDKSPVLDMKTAEYTIQGLCATDRWRESFDYLNKLTHKPSLTIRNALACAAIRNGDETLTWEILMHLMKAGETPSEKVFEEFLLVALEMVEKNSCQSSIFLHKVFQYMEARDVIVGEKVVKMIANYFERHPFKWNISYTKVNRKGQCEACGRDLKLTDLTSDEFNYLKGVFLERVVKKSDLFINTTAIEFQQYVEFIEHYKPFHVVVDGLNAAYTYPLLPKSRTNLAFQLLKIVKKLAGSTRKVLVMGRRHMRHWPPIPMKRISEKAKLFYTDNISQDDPFLLYAALASGPNTLFLSVDLMRDHISRLQDPYTIQLFKKWQQSHQIFVTCDEDNVIKFAEPLRHSIQVQGKVDHRWHIPFDDSIGLDPYEELNNWLCVRRDLET